MMLLWRNAFPRSQKELESEKARGDAFTWRVSLDARAGAMAAIHALLRMHSTTAASSSSSSAGGPPAKGGELLLSEDVLRRLAVPVEACLTLCAHLPPVVKAYPAELKALSAMLRLRLFETLALMPPGALEGSYTQLLRLLVSTN